MSSRRHRPRRESFASYYAGRRLLDALKGALNERGCDFASSHFEAAIAGDPEEAASLVYAVPNDLRGHCALALHLLNAPTPAMRSALEAAWLHDHDYLVSSVRNRHRLGAMFRHAAFDLPSSLPDHLTVWRGVYGTNALKGARGLSWTHDRRVACWFATTWRRASGSPLVIRATVARSDIAMVTNERSEDEVVTFRVRDPVVDGEPDEWRKLGTELEHQKQQRQKTFQLVRGRQG